MAYRDRYCKIKSMDMAIGEYSHKSALKALIRISYDEYDTYGDLHNSGCYMHILYDMTHHYITALDKLAISIDRQQEFEQRIDEAMRKFVNA